MKIKYYINKEKGTIFCKMENCFKEVLKIFEKDGGIWREDLRYCFMPDTFCGKAKLSPEDQWDEEMGKRIARNKMLLKFYISKGKILDKTYQELLSQMKKLSERRQYCSDKVVKAKNNEL